ncbi:Long-chain-fatty-acid--CoA ligase [Paraconexibacter sp. AEG42_29]|uniref:Long-chain-fatty-acid--CoA ligase n=1 Tax=Paraconexibacter sp. AEG42_29 TaxID=2997339 RepID=A0AAU7B113_9ACTN
MYPGAQDPSKPAIIMAGSGHTTTYGEVDAAANQIAQLFRDAGLQPGDHVAFVAENSPEYLVFAWGAHYAGLLYTACSTQLTGEEMGYIIDNCEARIAVFSSRYADRVKGAQGAAPKVEKWYAMKGEIDGLESFEEAYAKFPAEATEPDRIAGRDMLYSSGTTGKPKGIRPADLTAPLETEPIIVTPILKGMFGVGADDVYLNPAPLYHAAPLRFCMANHQLGGTVVVMERWDEAKALDYFAQYGVTVTQLVPTMFVRMLRLPEDVRAAADVSSLRLVIHAAAPCPREVKQQMLDWWGPIIHEYYASTEACGLTWVTPDQWLAKPGTVGKALVGVPHIVDEDGNEVPAGTDGAVWFSDGPQFQYHNDPEKTAGVTNDKGWQTFGDIGHLDEDGFLFLTDRASYMIITGGVNVYPQEAEDALQSHPKVMDAAVFGVPHPDFGEAVQAVVQPVEMPADEAAAAALEEELIAHCRSGLAKLKCPSSVDFREELPRTPTGKLLKRLLKDEYKESATAGAAG